MAYYQRNILICKLKNLEHQDGQRMSFVPELSYLLGKNYKKIFHARVSHSLKQKGKALLNYKTAYGTGVLPLNLTDSRIFVEKLYRDLLNNHIPLPASVVENDLKYRIKNFNPANEHVIVDTKKIKIDHQQLTFFSKYLPLFGNLITFTMTVGLTISALTTLLGWGWCLLPFLLFGVSKFLTSYADISGGPERRFQTFGFWLDRIISAKYHNHLKKSYPRLILNIFVTVMLTCSCLLTWYAGWQMICHINGLAILPDGFAATFAGLYAWSSASSNFGRLYYQLFDLLLGYVSPFFSFDNVREEDKINLKYLSKQFLAHQTSVGEHSNVANNQSHPILFHYRNQCEDKAKETMCLQHHQHSQKKRLSVRPN